MKRLSESILRYKKTAAVLLCVLIAAAVSLFVFLSRPHVHPASTNPNIINPIFAVEFLQTGNPRSLYFTLSAHDYLAQNKPDWISAHNTRQELLDFYHAGQDAALWRRLDREFHFDAVLLCGDPSEYEPLLDHLMTSKDWTLVYLDHTSFIFKRSPAELWTLGDLLATQQKFANYPPIDHAAYLTQSAAKLLAIRKNDLAKQQLDQSLALDRNSPDTWTQMAIYNLQTGKQTEALDDTARALKLDKDHFRALTTRVRALFAMKQYEDALHVSQHLLETQKGTVGYAEILRYHAGIAHEAHAYTEEIETLKNLIDIVSRQNQSVAFYRVMLGQAYEMEGQAQPALDEFQKAIDENSLGDGVNHSIELQMDSIKKQLSDGI